MMVASRLAFAQRHARLVLALVCLLVSLAACSVPGPLFGALAARTTTNTLLNPVSTAVMSALTSIPDSEFVAVGAGSAKTQFAATPAHTALLTVNGKPEVIFVGAEYCPYCAAQRWSIIIALSRFGSVSGLLTMRSSANDIYPNTPTFTFRSAHYTSSLLTFNATEVEDRNGNALATPLPDVMTNFTQYDAPPYTSSQGSIPFMSYANQYIAIGSAYNPSMLQNLDWQQVAEQLKDPQSEAAQAIIGEANQQTAALCSLTHNQPGSVCVTSTIQRLETTLPAAK
jgi:hypothetical protein